MKENHPNCNPESVFSVKRTCAELGICKTTLRKLRRSGVIKPCNSNPNRFKYTGQSINECWEKVMKL